MVPDISSQLSGSMTVGVSKPTSHAAADGQPLDRLGVVSLSNPPEFKEVIRHENQVRFSAHAAKRLSQRDISLSRTDLARIDLAAERVARKGANDSLFLLGDLGLIVNVKNRTVLTAIAQDDMKEGIFTNIDSTVIIPAE